MATQNIPVGTLSVEQAVSWLQPHITTWTGYAFALAQKAGLSPEAAARIFMQPVLDEGQTTFQADAAQLEQQAKQNATMMALLHGAGNVHLERDGDTWLLKAALGDFRQKLENWGVSLEFFARWLGEQARLIGGPKGIAYSSWLEGDTLHIQLRLAPHAPHRFIR